MSVVSVKKYQPGFYTKVFAYNFNYDHDIFYLKVDFDAVYQEEHDHDEQQNCVTAVEDVSVETLKVQFKFEFVVSP